MTTTTYPNTTTMPSCPRWCDCVHDVGELTREGRDRFIDENGEHLPAVGAAIYRDHATADQEWAWLERTDVLLPDGTWRIGRTEIGVGVVTPTGTLDLDRARDLAARLAVLSDEAVEVVERTTPGTEGA